MPSWLDQEALRVNIEQAHNMAEIQPGPGPRPRLVQHAEVQDPGLTYNRISAEDLLVFKDNFPHLRDFSDVFLQSITIDELLRLETTSIRIPDAERSKDSEEKLATNSKLCTVIKWNVQF